MSAPSKTPSYGSGKPQQPRPASQPPLPTHLEDGSAVPWTGLSILIVVAGLILFMAVPWRAPSPQHLLEQRNQLRAELSLEQLKLAIRDYRHDHGEWPGARPTEAGTLAAPVFETEWLSRQLRMATNTNGEVSPQSIPEYPNGPYLSGDLPLNPRTGLRSVRLLEENESFDAVRDGIFGWLYDPRTGEVRAHQLPFPSTYGSASIR